jgi:hypothetical protein
MRGTRTWILLLAAAVIAAGVACGQTVKPISSPSSFSPLPSPSIPTSLPPQVQQTLCQHLADLQQRVNEVQASPTMDAAQVKSALSKVSSDLQSDQQQLQSAGQAQLASVVQGVATAVNTLVQSIPSSGSLPSGIATGLAIVTGALQQIPPSICPQGAA